MAAHYSDDQSDKPSKRPVEGVRQYPISQQLLLKMRREGLLLVPEKEMKRYINGIRKLESPSNNWIAAVWALIGIAATLAGIAFTIPGELLVFGILAASCGAGALICYVAHRQVNQGRENAAEELAREMEEAEVDRIEILPEMT